MQFNFQTEPQDADLGLTVPANSLRSYYIDISQVASLMNRRFYRQGLNWVVGSIDVFTKGATEGVVACLKLPNTWVMSNAWEKSFRVWREMIKNATEESGMQSIEGKFLDFKIFADAGHHAAGVDSNLMPYAIETDATALVANYVPTPGQWQMSDIAIPATTGSPGSVTDYELIAVGPNDPGAGASTKDAKSVVQGYADSRALPSQEDPNVPDDASLNWMLALFNEGTLQDNAVVGMLEVTGDNPPYPFENDKAGNADTFYPGGERQLPTLELHDWELVTSTTVGGQTVMKGGNFQCGLMKLVVNNTDDNNAMTVAFQVNMVPGPHRGYFCEPMQDV